MNIIPPIPEDILNAARAYTRSETQFDRKLLDQAHQLAEAANQIVQRVGVVTPATLQEVIENLLMGVTPTHFDQDALGTLIQAGHTTAGYEQSHFYRGLLLNQGVIGYNNDWSRFGTSLEVIDASGPLRVTEFWGAMHIDLPSGRGPAMPAKPLMGLIKKTTGNSASDTRVQWGFRLSPDYKHSGYFIPVTPVISQD